MKKTQKISLHHTCERSVTKLFVLYSYIYKHDFLINDNNKLFTYSLDISKQYLKLFDSHNVVYQFSIVTLVFLKLLQERKPSVQATLVKQTKISD